MQRQIGSGGAAVVSVVDREAAVVVSVSEDLKGSVDAVELLHAGSPTSTARAVAAPTSPKEAAPTAPAPTPPGLRSSARWQASRRRNDHHVASASTAWRLTLPSPRRAVIFRVVATFRDGENA